VNSSCAKWIAKVFTDRQNPTMARREGFTIYPLPPLSDDANQQNPGTFGLTEKNYSV
jgi:hypothetical protein